MKVTNVTIKKANEAFTVMDSFVGKGLVEGGYRCRLCLRPAAGDQGLSGRTVQRGRPLACIFRRHLYHDETKSRLEGRDPHTLRASLHRELYYRHDK